MPMLILLLTSSLALLFVPLKSNVLSGITVTIGDVEYVPGNSKLTVPVHSSAAVTAGNSFKLAIFDAATGTGMIGSEVDVKTLLDGTQKSADAPFLLSSVKKDLDAVYIDIIETDATDSSTRSMISGGRKAVTFRQIKSMAYAVDGADKLKVTLTLDDEVTGATFQIPTGNLPVTKVEAKKYSVAVPITMLLDSSPLVGYFMGTNLATSSLPFTIPAPTPDPKLELLDTENAKCILTTVPTGAAVMIYPTGGQLKEITKPQGKDYYQIRYSDLVAACPIYFYNDVNTQISEEETIPALPAFTAPTKTEWLLATDPTDKTPLLKVTFGTALANRKLVVVDNDDDVGLVDLSAAEKTLTPAQITTGPACYIVTDADGIVPTTLPLALAKASFTQTPAAAVDRSIQVNVEMGVGRYKAKPTGVMVVKQLEPDLKKFKYHPLTWDATTAGKAAFEVHVDEWKHVIDEDVVSFVVGNYDKDDLNKIVSLSKTPVIIPKKAPSTSVTVGPSFTYNPTTAALTVPVKSAGSVTASASAFTLAVFDSSTEGEELVTRVDVKSLLDATEGQTASVPINLAGMPVNGRALYIDLFEEPTGRGEFSTVAGGERVAATFNGKATGSSVVVAKAGESGVKFTFTLAAPLTTAIADTKFVFNGVAKDVAVVDAATKKYSVTITTTDLLTATPTVGYFKGDSLTTSSFPMTLFATTPEVTLKHKDMAKAEVTFTNAPASPGKVWLKEGEEAAEPLTLTGGKCEIDYAKLALVSFYYTLEDGTLDCNKNLFSLPAFTVPVYKWVPVSDGDDRTPKVKAVFEDTNANRKLIIPGDDGDYVIPLTGREMTFSLSDIIQTTAYYIVIDSAIPKTLPLPIPAAVFTQAKEAQAEGKIAVTVTITAGLLTAKPTGLLVHAEGERDSERMKYYPFTWSTDEDKANEATAEVTVADFKDLTAKNIESYVASKADEEEEPAKISNAFIVIPKKEEPGKDGGAFGQMVSILAVLLSLSLSLFAF